VQKQEILSDLKNNLPEFGQICPKKLLGD